MYVGAILLSVQVGSLAEAEDQCDRNTFSSRVPSQWIIPFRISLPFLVPSEVDRPSKTAGPLSSAAREQPTVNSLGLKCTSREQCHRSMPALRS